MWGSDDDLNFNHVELKVPMGHPGEQVQQEVKTLSQSSGQVCGLEKEIWDPAVHGCS